MTETSLKLMAVAALLLSATVVVDLLRDPAFDSFEDRVYLVTFWSFVALLFVAALVAVVSI